jgi:hypothetical protein
VVDERPSAERRDKQATPVLDGFEGLYMHAEKMIVGMGCGLGTKGKMVGCYLCRHDD